MLHQEQAAVGLECIPEVVDLGLDQRREVAEGRDPHGRPGEALLELRLLELQGAELPENCVNRSGPHPELDRALDLSLDLGEWTAIIFLSALPCLVPQRLDGAPVKHVTLCSVRTSRG